LLETGLTKMAATEKSAEMTPDFAVSTAMPRDYFELMKPGVMRLVMFTAIAGLVIAPGGINPLLAVIAILCIAVGAGASGALNMWYDADLDAVMTRTAKRPIPDGRVTKDEALTFGLTLAFLSVLALGVMINWLSAALLAFTIFFYVVVYSMWLKRATPQNIVIGGAAGAFPPMIGWAIVTNSVTIESLILFAIIFIWTPPHFWALALFKSGDYGAVGIPMMPNVVGNRSTKNQIFGYSLILAPVGFLPYVLGFAGIAFGAASALLGLAFIWFAWKVWQMDSADEKMIPAKKLFGFSILYLFALFGVMILEVALPSLVALIA